MKKDLSLKKPYPSGWSYWLGTAMMVVGVAGIMWTFYPILREEWLYRLGRNQNVVGLDQTYSLSIPAIGVAAPVIAGVNPYKPSIYREALQHGVAQAEGTALPGENGTQFLFAHSSDAPWRMTRTNTAFYRLNKVKPGDKILVTYQDREYEYRVNEIKTVWSREVSFLKEQTKDQLILQTCTPMGTDWKRLLVLAEPVQ